ncbi:MAG TPA: hypothetical protein VGS22_25605 [Thermoanaerobaculia bacterium]|jgi:hypothetical protein|nr:hypothetical protein [Thermoanaerobaculia bacterium]
MNRKSRPIVVIISLLVGATGALLAQDVEKDAEKARKDTKSGVVLGVAPKGAVAAVATSCSLTVSPNPATNGTVLGFSISYSPCDSQPHKETFWFNWPTNLGGFVESTTRQKMWTATAGCVSSSFENTLVPSALAVKGSTTVTVESRNTTTNALICTASAPLTIN